jgi:hypothetical protein
LFGRLAATHFEELGYIIIAFEIADQRIELRFGKVANGSLIERISSF